MYARSKRIVTRAKLMKKVKKIIKILAHCALEKTWCLKTPLDLMFAKNSQYVNMQAILTNTCETTHNMAQKALISVSSNGGVHSR